VGETLANTMVQQSHDVIMGSRDAKNAKATAWAESTGGKASCGTFAEAAAYGETLFNCTSGGASLSALEIAGAENLKSKTLIDVANPLDFSRGMPPTLSVCNDDSLAEQIQRRFPDTHVVKALNTLTANLMVNPTALSSPGNLFICGNNLDAKTQTTELLKSWGWPEKRSPSKTAAS